MGIDFPVHVTLGQTVISPSKVAAELAHRLHEVKSQFANLSEIEVDKKVPFLVGSSARQLVFAAAVSGKKVPARRLSLQPVAIGAVVEVTKRLKPSV